MDTITKQEKIKKEHNKYANHLPSMQRNTSGQRRMRAALEAVFISTNKTYITQEAWDSEYFKKK